MPIFMDIRLCVTGLEDMETRMMLNALLTQHGGVYLNVLDTSATHLLCSTQTSPKIDWARDYNTNQRPDKRIKMIWEEWFWDCLEFGGKCSRNSSSLLIKLN